MSVHRLLILFQFAAALTSCSYGNRISDNVIQGPLGAIALTHVQPHAVAVLAGSDREKTVSVFYDFPSGAEITRFPVSRFASAVRAAAPNEIAISIAPPRGAGAVELWSVAGRHLSTYWTERPVLRLSRVENYVTYALAQFPTGLYAVPISIRNGDAYPAVRVPADADTVDVCTFSGRRFIITGSLRTQRIVLVDPATGGEIDTGLRGDNPMCLDQPPAILTLQHSAFTRQVQILYLSRLNERKVWIVAPSDGVDMAPADNGTIFILRVTGSDSQIQIWRPEDYMRQ